MAEQYDREIGIDDGRKLVKNGEAVFVWVHRSNIEMDRLAALLDVPQDSVIRVHPEDVMRGIYPEALLAYKANILVCRSGHTSGAVLAMLYQMKLAGSTALYNLHNGVLSIASPQYLNAIMHG